MNIFGSNDTKKFFKLTFEEIGENFLSAVILSKLELNSDQQTTEVAIELSDIFYLDIEPTHQEKYQISIPSKSDMASEVETFVHMMLGMDKPAEKFITVSYEDHFGSWFTRTLGYLRDGDSCGTKPVIDSFEKIGTDYTGTPKFKISITKDKFIESFKENILSQVYFGEESYSKLIKSVPSSTPAISASKQLEYLRTFLEKRSELTGETKFSFLLSDFNFRKAMMEFALPGGKSLIPSPFTSGTGTKAALPLLLAIQGELDIQQIKIKSSTTNLQDIDIQFSIHKPAIRNVCGANYCSLPRETRERMSAVELVNYEKILKVLQQNHCFHGNHQLEKDFILFCTWALKQVSHCIEEPSYLKSKATTWMRDNEEKGYKNMEDNFFLPFLYEKLRERFEEKVQKKPERFGGNVDILFGQMPVELKVRKGHKGALIDKVVDESYKPASQAAAYAAITRLGCVLVLDVPTGEPRVTNITSCIKVVTKKFEEADLPTSIIVFVFQCNTPKPSSAA
ncbi:hypothetical protein AAY86_10435 [Pseudomonas amygdali pv. tabaci str. ATCC 11528]|uniref:hypothetical protein n=1 Tax=Pseudomonas amygdali TaxID=47877 RepID=UPI0001BC95B5|nr:hypothetical protein [Pseudomonas amygdali]KEZ64740.1 hypothetical protein C1E_0225900 [Pseudomonas amygdali pv. tabaci str. ATCC 11528]KKY52927.1 hypothetical protein AAY86_10435 [Pseudomonas amygdali pv. tabaci str. ATCC 11528]QED85934.1 hypothetical protein PSYTB_20815 [Pseudomonas amygdali pv. tabaci str. ATCC 11528]